MVDYKGETTYISDIKNANAKVEKYLESFEINKNTNLRIDEANRLKNQANQPKQK